MGVPKKKTTSSKQGMRRSQIKMQSIALTNCPHCSQPIRPHMVCPNCGYYKGQKVIEIKTKSKSKSKK